MYFLSSNSYLRGHHSWCKVKTVFSHVPHFIFIYLEFIRLDYTDYECEVNVQWQMKKDENITESSDGGLYGYWKQREPDEDLGQSDMWFTWDSSFMYKHVFKSIC